MSDENRPSDDGPTSNSNKKQKTNNVTHPPPPKPITKDGDMPQKKFYRSRAHCNPLSHNDIFDYPTEGPDAMDWTKDHFVSSSKSSSSVYPTVLDIGCGFGGLTVALARLLPHEYILGIEIRQKVTEYVRLRIVALRKKHEHEKEPIHHYHYGNCSVLRTNAMKFMPNFIRPHSLSKLFLCFPDPHFKKKNHPRRILSDRLLSEYAHFLRPGHGTLYCITDVRELHQWNVDKCRAHPLFHEITDNIDQEDPCVKAMKEETEEGKKVSRAGADKYYAVFLRIQTDEDTVSNETLLSDFFKEGNFGVVCTDQIGKS